jgi:hypothetical protein
MTVSLVEATDTGFVIAPIEIYEGHRAVAVVTLEVEVIPETETLVSRRARSFKQRKLPRS